MDWNKIMQKPSWRIRRRIIHLTLLFCAFCISWVLIVQDDRSVLEIVVMSAFALAATVIGSYIFGAVWDDNNFMAQATKRIDVETDSNVVGTAQATVVDPTMVVPTVEGPET
jgi:hypothetical protein